MIFYFFLFLFISILLSQRNKFKQLNISALVFFILFIISAIRFDVGYDYMMYYKILDSSYNQFIIETERMELLNIILFKISRFIGMSQLYFIVTSAIIFFSIYKVVTNFSENIALSILLFMSIPIFYFNSFSIIRQFVAVALVFLGSTYLFNKKNTEFYLFVFLAFLFHKSAIIVVIFPLILLNTRYIRLQNILLFILSIFSSKIILFLASNFFKEYYEVYILRKLGTGGDKTLLLMQIIAFFLLLIPYKKINNKDMFFLKSFFIGIFIWGALSPYGHAGVRGALYFIIFFILLIPNLIETFNQRKLNRQLLYLSTVFFYFLTLWLGIKNPKKDPNIPYRISFLTDKSIYKVPDNEK